MSLSGLVAGGMLGYFRFGDSVGYAVVLGVGVAVILGSITWRTVRDPAQVAERTRRRSLSPIALRRAAIRLAIPFVALALAFIAGAAVASVSVFVITLAVGLVLRVFVLR
jgi:hypothetical protein